jgi:hypothetical protein
MVIEKSESVMLRLKEIADIGFSSALTSYIRNPIQFYFQKILRIRKLKKLKRISRWTLWEPLFMRHWNHFMTFVGRFISESDIQNCFKQIDDEVLKQFKVV